MITFNKESNNVMKIIDTNKDSVKEYPTIDLGHQHKFLPLANE